MKIARVEEMRNMDQIAIGRYGISDELLMENAGIATYQVIKKNYDLRKNNFIIFCGTGNNGGDGLVVTRQLHSNGSIVKLCILNNPDKFKGVSALNWQIIKKLPINIYIEPEIKKIEELIKEYDIIIDALFGTGLTRDIDGKYYQLIQLINAKKNHVVSIDIPSGINGNTGMVNGIAINADCTITMGLPKLGNILYPGYEYNGNLYVSHISFPPELYNNSNIKTQINLPVEMPKRPEDGHKGIFGNALFIAGAQNYYGAPSFSSLSFLKAGGGYSRLAAPASIIPYISTKASEVVFLPQKETDAGTLSLENLNELLIWSEKVDIIVIGPGLSLNKETQSLVRKLIVEINKPLLIDGDGLTALSQDVTILKKRKNVTILTPHVGEMSRLINLPVDKIINNKINIVQDFAQKYESICVLKGAHSIIGLPNKEIYINMTGNNGMASAGSGDVLTGIISAMHTLGLPIELAVKQGVLTHGISGDLASFQKGKDGMTAQDILDFLPEAMKIIRKNNENIWDFYGYKTIP